MCNHGGIIRKEHSFTIAVNVASTPPTYAYNNSKKYNLEYNNNLEYASDYFTPFKYNNSLEYTLEYNNRLEYNNCLQYNEPTTLMRKSVFMNFPLQERRNLCRRIAGANLLETIYSQMDHREDGVGQHSI